MALNLPLPLIQEELAVVKECTVSIGKLPLEGLPRNSVLRITDHPDMTSAVCRGPKALNKKNRNIKHYDETMKRAHGCKYQHCKPELKKTTS